MNKLTLVAVDNKGRLRLPTPGKERCLAFMNEKGEIIARTIFYTYEDIERHYETIVDSLITSICKKLSNSDWYSLKKGEYTIDERLYQKWYNKHFFIDGEDAREFLINCPNNPTLSNDFLTRNGALKGWKYFKRLRAAGFYAKTAALLAYTRGYIEEMDLVTSFDKEGEEALHLLGLTKLD